MKRRLLPFIILFLVGIACQGTDGNLAEKRDNTMPSSRIQDRFIEAAAAGELPLLLEGNATFNVEFPTMGGDVFWETWESGGWKLQVNKISGWWRILNSKDIRVARGTSIRQLEALLGNRPSSVLGNYMDKGCRFSRMEAPRPSGRSVILIHGWGVRAISMQKLAHALVQQGFDTYNYDYPTSECNLESHCQTFLVKYRELLAKLPEGEQIHFLTHSMGGLVLRGAMAAMTEAECRRIRAIVMLGPPNRGSGLAYFGEIPGVSAINASLQDMTPSESSFVSMIPDPAWLPPVGIIAGRYDGKVAKENTLLPDRLPCEHVIVPCTHPGLRNPANVMAHVLEFYDDLSFKESPENMSSSGQ